MPKGTLDAPEELAFEDTKPGSTTATWKAVENAELYNLQLWCEGNLVLQKDSIAGTSFRLSDLRTNVNYTYAVQAISDHYRNSNWAESEAFRATPDAISEITESTERVRIYDTKGCLTGECFADELRHVSVRPGIYFVRRSNGKIKKIMLR